MIKRLSNQKEIVIPCLQKSKKQSIGYQTRNFNLSGNHVFGKILCANSDECELTECKYHNGNISDW